ncbi:MAG: hypothetical protein KJZ62_00110 [Fimbriimonadaceae bacterium]|nr:hypothetical protein [Fimbriimonadaceae bacterium]QOJ11234.1 MAG: hypothetical protein HRU74_03900 [Chthonomonadaceae bacterium]
MNRDTANGEPVEVVVALVDNEDCTFQTWNRSELQDALNLSRFVPEKLDF